MTMSRAERRDEGVRMEFIAGLRLLMLTDYFGHAPQRCSANINPAVAIARRGQNAFIGYARRRRTDQKNVPVTANPKDSLKSMPKTIATNR
jgi:hypothetical protein